LTSDIIKSIIRNILKQKIMQTIEQAGIQYIKNNISIIPVNRDKTPLLKWTEFQTRRATETEFRQWLKDYPDMQIVLFADAFLVYVLLM